MFRLILNNDTKSLTPLTRELAKENQNLQSLRCGWQVLGSKRDISVISPDSMDSLLWNLREYSSGLRTLLTLPIHQLTNSPNTQRLLAYSILEDTSGTECIIRRSSPLNKYVTIMKPSGPYFVASRLTDDGESVALLSNISEAIRDLLKQDLRQTISQHSEDSKKARAFNSLCMSHIADKCKQGDACIYLHMPSDKMKESFNQRFRMFLAQMIVINNMGVTLESGERRSIQRYIFYLFF
jgi:hypothetical protein